jgi:hypothetical protein
MNPKKKSRMRKAACGDPHLGLGPLALHSLYLDLASSTGNLAFPEYAEKLPVWLALLKCQADWPAVARRIGPTHGMRALVAMDEFLEAMDPIVGADPERKEKFLCALARLRNLIARMIESIEWLQKQIPEGSRIPEDWKPQN